MTIYLVGAIVSCIVWFLLTKARMRGFYIPGPDVLDTAGPILPPLVVNDRFDLRGMMVVWLLFTFAWPLCWAWLILITTLLWLTYAIVSLWTATLGNEKLLRKIFGVQK